MKQIFLEEKQLQNLKAFLNRVTLTGKEVPVFIEILFAVDAAKDFVEVPVEKKEKEGVELKKQ